MKNLKIILIAVAVILCAVAALAVIGMIMNALYYVFWLGVLALGGAAAYKLFLKSNDRARLEGKSAVDELESADRALEKYKGKYVLK